QYTGYTTGKDVGTQLTLRAGTGDNINPSFYFSWKMPGDVGGDFYRDNIANCNQSVIIRGKKIIQEPGDKSGPTIQGIQALIDKDPLAHWDTGCKCVKGSAFAVSPRVFPIPLYDPELYADDQATGRDGSPDLIIVDTRGDAASAMSSIERLRAGAPGAGIFAVALVAEPDLILQAMRAGANEFFTWPPAEDTFHGAVRRGAARRET